MNTKLHTIWRRMNDRCYNTEHNSYGSYGGVGVYVCDEWKSYKGFEAWAIDNYYDGSELDKDILYKGNQCYSPEFCRFVPISVNRLLTSREASRGELPLGVSLPSNGRKYRAQITRDGKKVHLGTRSTALEAHQLWQEAKIAAITEAAMLEGVSLDISQALLARAQVIKYDRLHNLETKSV